MALREMGVMTTAERIELKYVKGARGMTIQCIVGMKIFVSTGNAAA